VDGAALGLPVLPASTYCEAAGLVLALREGLDPGALVRPLGMLGPENHESLSLEHRK